MTFYITAKHWKYYKCYATQDRFHEFQPFHEVHCLSRNQTTFQECFFVVAKFNKTVAIVHWSHSSKYFPALRHKTDVTDVGNYAKSWSNSFSLKRWRNFDGCFDEKTNKVKTLRNAKVLTLDQVLRKIFRLWSFLVMSKRLWPGHSSFFCCQISLPLTKMVNPIKLSKQVVHSSWPKYVLWSKLIKGEHLKTHSGEKSQEILQISYKMMFHPIKLW